MVLITESRNCPEGTILRRLLEGGPKRVPVDNVSHEPRPSNPLVVQNSVAVITKCFPRCPMEHRSDGAIEKVPRTLCPGMS